MRFLLNCASSLTRSRTSIIQEPIKSSIKEIFFFCKENIRSQNLKTTKIFCWLEIIVKIFCFRRRFNDSMLTSIWIICWLIAVILFVVIAKIKLRSNSIIMKLICISISFTILMVICVGWTICKRWNWLDSRLNWS